MGLNATLPGAIRTDNEHRRLLDAAAALMEKPDNAISEEEGRLLELLSIVIDEYETRAHPLPKAEPHQMLAYLLEEKRLVDSAQEPCIGDPQRQKRHQQGASQATRQAIPSPRRSINMTVSTLLHFLRTSQAPCSASKLV